MNKFEELIDFSGCKKKIKERTFFTSENIKKYNIRKYEYLVNNYDTVLFHNVFYDIPKKYKIKNLKEYIEDYHSDEIDLRISYLYFADRNVKTGLNCFMNMEDLLDEELTEGELVDNFIPFYYESTLSEWFLLEKQTNKIFFLELYYDEDEHRINWWPVADSFDEFMDGLFLREKSNESNYESSEEIKKQYQELAKALLQYEKMKKNN